MKRLKIQVQQYLAQAPNQTIRVGEKETLRLKEEAKPDYLTQLHVKRSILLFLMEQKLMNKEQAYSFTSACTKYIYDTRTRTTKVSVLRSTSTSKRKHTTLDELIGDRPSTILSLTQ